MSSGAAGGGVAEVVASGVVEAVPPPPPLPLDTKADWAKGPAGGGGRGLPALEPAEPWMGVPG